MQLAPEDVFRTKPGVKSTQVRSVKEPHKNRLVASLERVLRQALRLAPTHTGRVLPEGKPFTEVDKQSLCQQSPLCNSKAGTLANNALTCGRWFPYAYFNCQVDVIWVRDLSFPIWRWHHHHAKLGGAGSKSSAGVHKSSDNFKHNSLNGLIFRNLLKIVKVYQNHNSHLNISHDITF